MITSIAEAVSAVAVLLKRSIDLFDPDPERVRKRKLADAKTELRRIQEKLRDTIKKVEALER